MACEKTDILMITYNRPDYTRRTLPRLLETCDEHTRVWLWHNGNDQETLEIVRQLSTHPRVARFHHSPENRKLNDATNWMWENSDGDLLGKVDDDCLMPPGWVERLRDAHRAVACLGVVGCWHFVPEDVVPELVARKLRRFAGGHEVMVNCWVGGSGYLLKRECVRQQGLLSPGSNFSAYCVALAARGWINGWYHPFIYQQHLDDPRVPGTGLANQAEFERRFPLTAATFRCRTLDEWRESLHEDALLVQKASVDPFDHMPQRSRLARLVGRLRAVFRWC